MIRLGAIDDDRLLLDCFQSRLADIDDFELTRCSTTVDDFLKARLPADVVMLDLRLGDQSDPASNVARLRRAGYRVCIVSTHHDQPAAQATLRAGAEGYVTKDHDLDRVLQALRVVAEGCTADSPELAFTLMQDRGPNRPQLSDQERRLLVLLASVKAKYEQTGRPAKSKLQLAERAREDGLIN